METQAKQELCEKMNVELQKAKQESETYLQVIMDMKNKQANEMDQVQNMHTELMNAKQSLSIEKKLFEEKQIEFE